MPDLDARADRVTAIIEGNFGKILSPEGDIMHVKDVGLNSV